MKSVLILGAGTAGTIVANRLRAAHPELSITVVDRDDEHHYQPGYLFVPFGSYDRGKVVAPRQAQLADGIRFVEAEIERVDAAANRVHLAGSQQLEYDVLIIATGVTPRPEQTPGMSGPEFRRSVHEFYTLEGAEALAGAVKQWQGGNLVVHITEMPIKCPVAPLEFTFLMDDWNDRHGLRRKTHLTYVTPLDGAFTKPVASRELGDALSSRGINVETDFQVERVDDERRVLVGYDGREIPFDLLVTVPLNMGADYIARSGLGDELNLVPCDKHTMLATGYGNIFVLGDAGTLPTSKAGAVAHFAIDVFMANFAEYLAGKPLSHSFDGHSNCFIETGRGQAMLLDFNYETEPLTGTFPLPVVGPLALLKESRANHLAKLAFRLIYWKVLLPGRPLPLPAAMYLMGKHLEGPAAAGQPVSPPDPEGAPSDSPVVPSPPDAAAPAPDGNGHPHVPTF